MWQPTITRQENLLCSALRSRGIQHVQNPKICGYYPDIALTDTNILIEIDGSVHASAAAKARDRQRTHHLKLAGYRVLRFSNKQVELDRKTVLTKIEAALAKHRAGHTGLVFRKPTAKWRKDQAREKAKSLNQRPF